MGKVTAHCVICGRSPTVKSHLFPRALALDIRGNAPNVVEGSRFSDGYVLRQNGAWDDGLLCEEHERVSGRGEKYAVELIRSFPHKRLSRPGGGYLLPNPKPELLSHFVHSTVWKFVNAEFGRKNDLSLGPYENPFRERVFGEAVPDLPFIVGRHQFHLAGREIPFGVPPHRQKLDRWKTWLFAIGGLQFHVKTDKRPFPDDWKPFVGNDNDPLVLTETGMDVLKTPSLRPIFDRMKRR